MRWLAILMVTVGTGCITVSLQRTPKPDDSVEVSPPGEDGTRYIAVRGGRRTGAPTLKRKWSRVATKACEGDYQLMSEGATESRRAGFVTSRMHEGFVRCMLPSEAEPDSNQEGDKRDAAERRTARR